MMVRVAEGVEEQSMCRVWVALAQASEWPSFRSTNRAAMPSCCIMAALPAAQSQAQFRFSFSAD